MRPIAFAFAELYARGVMQHLLELLGQARAVVWTGVLFGLGHALSGGWFERRLDDTVVQVLETTAFGACFAALRFRVGTLWPLVLLHALDDLLQLRTAGALAFGAQMTVAVAYAAYAWWLLRIPTRLANGEPNTPLGSSLSRTASQRSYSG